MTGADSHIFDIIRASDGMPLQQMTDAAAAQTRAQQIETLAEGV
jgi:hypothetical protein